MLNIFSYTSVISLCSLNINPYIWFANTFFYSVDCLFILLMLFFVVQKLLGLMWSHFFIFAFVAFALMANPKKKTIPRLMSRSLRPMFSSRRKKLW